MQIETSTGKLDVSDAVFNCPYNEPVVHQALKHFINKGHTGSKAQKTRAMVSGGGRKPWRQKGTGNARVGSSRNPIWRGGGVTFAATPTTRKSKLNKKMYRYAMRSLISEVCRQGRLMVVDSLELAEPKTKLMIEKLKSLSLQGSVLIVTEDENKNIHLSANNLTNVGVLSPEILDPHNILRFDTLLFTKSTLEKFQERLA